MSYLHHKHCFSLTIWSFLHYTRCVGESDHTASIRNIVYNKIYVTSADLQTNLEAYYLSKRTVYSCDKCRKPCQYFRFSIYILFNGIVCDVNLYYINVVLLKIRHIFSNLNEILGFTECYVHAHWIYDNNEWRVCYLKIMLFTFCVVSCVDIISILLGNCRKCNRKRIFYHKEQF